MIILDTFRFLLLLNVGLHSCFSYRILYLLPSGPPSHVRFANAIIDALSEKGHQVTFLTVQRSEKERPNVTEIFIDTNILTKVFSNPFESTLISMVYMYLQHIPEECMNSLEHPASQKALNDNYDAAFITGFFCDCYYYSINKKKIPLILISPNTPAGYQWTNIGVPPFPSISPPHLLGLHHPMSLLGRISSTLLETFEEFIFNSLYIPSVQRICEERRHCTSDGPTLGEITSNNPFLVTNGIKTLEKPIRPHVPSLIYVGGIHIKQPTQINKEIEDWANKSGPDGFIIFSLGSFASTKETPIERLLVLFNAFKKLKQQVIMKWDGEVSIPVPPNIKLSKWLPQQQLLAHPKLQLFITHGGLLSTMEAMYHGVPLVGLPIFIDQTMNMANCAHGGWATYAPWPTITQEDLEKKVAMVLQNRTFKENAMKASRIMRDHQHSPKDELVYWTEYIIRHNGASHLRSAFIDMPWYKVYNVDVWLVIIGIPVLIVAATFLIIRSCIRFSYRRRYKKKVE